MLTKQQVIRLEKMAELCQDGHANFAWASDAVSGSSELFFKLRDFYDLDWNDYDSLSGTRSPDDRVMMILFYLEANRGEN